MAIPAGMMEKALRGLETLYRRGIRYPISYAGAEQDLTQAFPMSYGGMGQLEAIRGKDSRVLLGLTGGIATGKSTVVQMLRDKGAPVIDFDLIAREVVEPDKPAWKEIVTYFGEQVLQEDRSLDRKRLSDIVFQDLEKRKKLEGFTHPRIHEEFVRQLNDIVTKDPSAIVQVDIPLLIELNLQYLFHKVLVVYAPRDQQIRRLRERDGISEEAAVARLNAQLPIDEKVGYADYVIHNDGSIEETQRQVDAVWEGLKGFQEEKAKIPERSTSSHE
jgi:dephospho-CoA kinase